MKVGTLYNNKREFKHPVFKDRGDDSIVYVKEGEICMFMGAPKGTAEFFFPKYWVTIYISNPYFDHFEMICEI